MSRYKNLTTVCCAAVLTLGLAACGGSGGSSGGSSSGSGDSMATMPTDPPPTQADMDAATIAALQGQIDALREQLDLEADDDLSGSVTELQNELDGLQQDVQDAQDDADKAAYMAMAVTAAKLYAGISAPMGDANTPANTDRAAAYNDAATAIVVSIGNGTDAPTPATLSENKKAMVADNHGWAGKMYADPAGGDSYEAVVYSNVEARKMGKKFGGAAANNEFEYELTNGATVIDTGTAGVQARVALTGVTRTAGTETFKLPSSNPNDEMTITVDGSYHGVSGTYSCTPDTPANGCSATVAAKGFTLGGADSDGWTFAPDNANDRVMESEDIVYASYGWWLRKAANDGPFTASAFTDEKGTVGAASGLDDLNGTATYMGGAAGKYALSSSTGGTNDAGHFTARATLEANFTANAMPTAISGTIDQFMGADGMPRDWEVALKGSTISATGMIGNDGTSTASPGGTVWTIGGTAAAADGDWSGSLLNQPADGDGVPQVATGTFYSTYGTNGGEGRMVGAFGANKQ